MNKSKNIKDVVQPTKWYSELPRKQYENYTKVGVYQNWFEVYRLPHNVYAIYESGHFQEVISFLILGKEKAMLLDTGLGMGNIKLVVEDLTELPVIVVNSHCHFDHIGDNYRFDNIYIYNDEGAISRAEKGLENCEVEENLVGDSTYIPYPIGFNPANYHIKPANKITVIEDGHVFDLGDRELIVKHTPGHSPDSIMLLDEKNSILFTGDTFYPAVLYAHLESSDNVNSVFDIYLQTMKELSNTIDVKYLYCSHNYPIVKGSKLKEAAKAFIDIKNGGLEFVEDSKGLKKYTFDEFCIVTK